MATLLLDGWGNGYAPEQETETPSYFSELEMTQDKLKNQIRATLYLKNQLKRLAQIEATVQTFGSLTFEEEKEKQSILTQYL